MAKRKSAEVVEAHGLKGIDEKTIIAAIRKLLMETAIPEATVMSAQTRPISQGARVHYIAVNRRANAKPIDDSVMSPRLRQVWRAITKSKDKGLASRQIEAACGINRNAVSGAVFQLRNMGLITTKDVIL